jgi:hypothetical protein
MHFGADGRSPPYEAKATEKQMFSTSKFVPFVVKVCIRGNGAASGSGPTGSTDTPIRVPLARMHQSCLRVTNRIESIQSVPGNPKVLALLRDRAVLIGDSEVVLDLLLGFMQITRSQELCGELRNTGGFGQMPYDKARKRT